MQTKVLFILISSKFTENDELAVEDIENLCKSGVSCRALCLEGTEVHRRLTQVFGAAVSEKMITVKEAPRTVLDFSFKRLLDSEINGGVDIIHAYGSDELGSILPWLTQSPKVSVVVSETPLVQKRLSHIFQSFFYRRIDALIVPTRALKKRVQLMRRSLERKVKVIHPGLDLTVFKPESFDFSLLRKKWNVSPEDHLVGMIASQEYPKAQSAFIKAAASFLRNEELAKVTKFIIVGYQIEGSDELTSLINQFHLQDKIILAPLEDSIPKVLGTLDVYVIPSSKAMFGLQAVEALAMGTPIICAAGPDSAEWIGSSRAGLLMRSGDSFDLQRKLRSILENPDELKEMGRRAVEFAKEHYDRANRTQRILELYARMKARRSA